MRKSRIRVRISNGLFSNERVIEALDMNGHVYRTYVSDSEISKDGGNEGTVEVQVVESNLEFTTVVLPGEPVGSENNLMTVRSEQILVPA